MLAALPVPRSLKPASFQCSNYLSVRPISVQGQFTVSNVAHINVHLPGDLSLRRNVGELSKLEVGSGRLGDISAENTLQNKSVWRRTRSNKGSGVTHDSCYNGAQQCGIEV